MSLDPDRYECPEHHADLTGQVAQALEEQGTPLAYRKPLLGRRSPGPRRFQVIVTCPGSGGAGPHQLTCTGTHTS